MYGYKRWSKPKISFSSFRLAAGGLGGAAQKNERKFLGLPRATSGSASEARREHHHALRAYDFIQSHHARGACEDQSLRDWKKVRAKVNISPPNVTSASERKLDDRATGAEWGKKRRRFATNSLGTGAPKRADLSLFRI